MHRFFTDRNSICGDTVKISGDDAHHISKVLRLKEDDEIIVCDKEGTDYHCSIKLISKDEVEAWILKKETSSSEPPVKITLYQGVPKGDKLESVIQKCVELGAFKIVPVAMKRSVAVIKDKEKKKVRMQRIAQEASKQCQRAVVPEVSEVLSFKEALLHAQENDLKLLPYEAENKNKLKDILKENKNSKTIAVFIGPEGGFDEEEISLARQSGFQILTLGPRIMRTETAPLACISAIMYEIGDW
ncbi:MAG: 16S rRNA (uracil(1498)-N(3))-methyltransferase [Clostridia bacterium]|nr:16S rRNA (uracil(1498)-N(3))-methyltransferase [Clostridia bacterium]